MTIQEKAKEIYFNSVAIPEARTRFEKSLNTLPVYDKRAEGFYCSECKRFSQTQRMPSFESERVIHIRSNGWDVSEIWIVRPHYDGCRGWN